MTPATKQFLYWTPRFLGLLMAAFLAMFAFDVFSEKIGFWETLFALLAHLVPAAIMIATLAIAWRQELVGGLVFLGLALVYIGLNLEHLDWIELIAGPLALIGFLFVFSWRSSRPNRARA